MSNETFEESTNSALSGKALGAALRASQPLPANTELMTPGQVARALVISLPTLSRYTRAGLLKFVKLGDAGPRSPRRYRLADVTAFIASRVISK